MKRIITLKDKNDKVVREISHDVLPSETSTIAPLFKHEGITYDLIIGFLKIDELHVIYKEYSH